jgi:hypothetical protein
MVSNPSAQKTSWSKDVQWVSQYTEPEKDSLSYFKPFKN